MCSGGESGQQAVRFSVIIPAYNSAATLAKAIQSVLEQRWAAHEVIVVDDGSEDETSDIARQFGNRIRLIRQENQGVSAARNRGAESATGNWLAFLDADDWYYPDRLRWHAEWVAEDPDLDFLTGDYEYRDSNGGLIGTSMASHRSGMRLLEKAGGADKVIMEEESDLEEFVADHFGDTHTLSIPRETFMCLGGYPQGFKVCEDVHFLARLCAQSRRVGVICRPMAVYRIHGESATRRDPLRAQEYNVETLLDLSERARDMPEYVRRAVARRLRAGRLNLAYSCLKAGNRRAAIKAVLPSLTESPGWASVRNLLSIVKG